MQKKLLSKSLVIGIIVFFIGAGIYPSSGILIEEKPIIPLTSGNTLYVGGDGPGNYSKIQDAINVSADGDTVFVYSNHPSYRENLIINVSINLIGENKDTTIISGSFFTVIQIYAKEVSISRFTIKLSGGDLTAGIYIRSNNNNIYDNIFSDNEDSIYLESSNFNTIKDNTFLKSQIGINLKKSRNNTIKDNNFSSNHIFGIWLDYSSNDNNIKGNSYNSNNHYCIRIWGSNNTIIDNTVSNKNGDGITIRGTNNTITNNNILNNKWIGIDVRGNINKITGNTISNNHLGIIIDGSNSNTIKINTISNNYYGLRFRSSSNNIISDNSFFNNGLYVTDSYQNTVSNNTVNGKPLVYLEDESDKVIDYEVGQIILLNCNKITIENLKIDNTDVGIELWKTDNSIIRNNDFSNKRYGIYLYESSDNTIIDNTITSNIISGIFLGYSSDNTITGNIISNNGAGISFSYSTFNVISSNTISNNEDGIFLGGYIGSFDLGKIFSGGSKNNIIQNNNFLGNKRHAFFLNSFSNQWMQNYWDRPRLLPKLIGGEIYWYKLGFGVRHYHIPWFPQIDMNPSKEPYDI
jgi:parallel beta-helix repeat protein